MKAYLKDTKIDKNNGYNSDQFSPYNYGYIVEVSLDKEGESSVAKHYVTGKYTPELALVMPDHKTFYMSDDGDGKGLYKFVSDMRIDAFNQNWQGSLYIAKVKQLDDKEAGSFEISWIKLAEGSDKQIKNLIAKKIKISDIFELTKIENEVCEAGFKNIYEDKQSYCLRLKKAKESEVFKDDKELKMAAGFLESRKYGAYLGGTTEFNKEEGLTYDAKNNVLYLAMSSIKGAMLKKEKDRYTDDVHLDKNICGAVYSLALDKNFSASKMRSLIVGKPLSASDKHSEMYTCSPESISNPDNIAYIGDDTLLIGEDTSLHLTNMLWAYNTRLKSITRIATMPIGTEITGLVRSKIDKNSFILLNLQHPFGDVPENVKGQKLKETLMNSVPVSRKNGVVGYIDFTQIKK